MLIKAWRLPDGRYRLMIPQSPSGPSPLGLCSPGQLSAIMNRDGLGSVGDRELAARGAEKVYGVVTGPSSCGCDKTGFRWVGASEVEAGRTEAKLCRTCDPSYHVRLGATYRGPSVMHQCNIIDVCGEADVAEAVYQAEFAGKIGEIT